MGNNLVVKAFTAAVLLACAGFASAATTVPANLIVTANVNSNCTIGTTAVAFGAYDPLTTHAVTPLDATGTVTITCTKGTTATIGLDMGGNALGLVRQMNGGGANRLSYELFQPASNAVGAACAYTTVWGTAIGTDTLAPVAAPSKAPRAYNVCGRVAAGQDPAAGNYLDTVIATVNF